MTLSQCEQPVNRRCSFTSPSNIAFRKMSVLPTVPLSLFRKETCYIRRLGCSDRNVVVVKKNEKMLGIVKVASDGRATQLLFTQMCPQPGEPTINRLCWRNRTSPGGRTFLEMTHAGPKTQIYEKEI